MKNFTPHSFAPDQYPAISAPFDKLIGISTTEVNPFFLKYIQGRTTLVHAQNFPSEISTTENPPTGKSVAF